MPDRVEVLDSGILEIRLLVGLINSGRLGTDRSSDAQSHPCQGRSQSRRKVSDRVAMENRASNLIFRWSGSITAPARSPAR
jgi:hypothetical protein